MPKTLELPQWPTHQERLTEWSHPEKQIWIWRSRGQNCGMKMNITLSAYVSSGKKYTEKFSFHFLFFVTPSVGELYLHTKLKFASYRTWPMMIKVHQVVTWLNCFATWKTLWQNQRIIFSEKIKIMGFLHLRFSLNVSILKKKILNILFVFFFF